MNSNTTGCGTQGSEEDIRPRSCAFICVGGVQHKVEQETRIISNPPVEPGTAAEGATARPGRTGRTGRVWFEAQS